MTIQPFAEGRSLGECEEVIQRGLATFVEVGRALAEIRDGRLYRTTHDTFEDYCQERWQFSRVRAHQLIEASGVLTMVNSDVPITSERQARALAPILKQLGPEAAAEILEEAAATGTITASGITEAAKRRADALAPSPVDEYIYADGSVRKAQLRADFSKWLYKINDAHLFDVQEMAAITDDPDYRGHVERIAASIHEWFEEYLAATGPKLRIVGSDK